MSDRRVFKFSHLTARKLAAAYCLNAPDSYVCTIDAPKRSTEQNEKMHAMIGDIAKCVPFMGKLINRDDMKRLLVDAFAKVMRDAGTPLHHDGRWCRVWTVSASCSLVSRQRISEYARRRSLWNTCMPSAQRTA